MPKRDLEIHRAERELLYWQKELQARRTARRPKKQTIIACFIKTMQASRRLEKLVLERDEAHVVLDENKLNVWRAFTVPTEFERESSNA